MSRYVIGEVRGFARPGYGGSNRPGLSVVITDSLDNHHIVGQFRSEDRANGPGGYLGEDEARRLGRELVARLELPGAVGSGAARSQGTAAPGPPGKDGAP